MAGKPSLKWMVQRFNPAFSIISEGGPGWRCFFLAGPDSRRGRDDCFLCSKLKTWDMNIYIYMIYIYIYDIYIYDIYIYMIYIYMIYIYI